MPHFIEHIVEPDELLVSWQQERGDRMRRFVGKLIRRGDDASFEYFRGTPDYDQACELGFEGVPGIPIAEGEHVGVLPMFMRRLPPRTRTDFQRYVQSFGIEHGDQISDFGLLGYSGAKLPGDNFTFIHPFTGADPPVEFLLLIAGYRYHQDPVSYARLRVGAPVTFEPEPDNEMDPGAILLRYEGDSLGYVCRGLTAQFNDWMARGYVLTAEIERLNGTPERPLVYLYVTIRA